MARKQRPTIGVSGMTAVIPIQATAAIEAASRIRVCSIANLIGEAIARTASEKSVSSLFD